MNILTFSKRYNMDVDSIGHKHGRAFHLPLEISKQGHRVTNIVTDYRTTGSVWSYSEGSALWFVVPIFQARFFIPNFLPYLNLLRLELRRNYPDLILAGSDAPNVIIGFLVSRLLRVRFIADIKDDFSTFGLTKIPFVESLYYFSLRKADAVSCVSTPLMEFLKSKGVSKVFVVENGIPEGFVKNIDKREARKQLGLPQDKFLVGTAGSLRDHRNIRTLFEGFEQLSQSDLDIGLVVAGSRERNFSPGITGSFYDLGLIDPEEVPVLLSALDLGIIANSNSDFGNRCYPQKYNEMLACRLPMGVSKVGVFSEDSLAPGVAFSFDPDDPSDLRKQIMRFYENSNRAAVDEKPTYWSTQAAKLVERVF